MPQVVAAHAVIPNQRGRGLPVGLCGHPLQVYLKHGLVKLEIALCKGKKLYDKREAMAEKDAKRDIERHFREAHR